MHGTRQNEIERPPWALDGLLRLQGKKVMVWKGEGAICLQGGPKTTRGCCVHRCCT